MLPVEENENGLCEDENESQNRNQQKKILNVFISNIENKKKNGESLSPEEEKRLAKAKSRLEQFKKEEEEKTNENLLLKKFLIYGGISLLVIILIVIIIKKNKKRKR